MQFVIMNNLKNLLRNIYNLPDTSIAPTELSNAENVDNGRNIILLGYEINQTTFLNSYYPRFIENMQREQNPRNSTHSVTVHYKQIQNGAMVDTDLTDRRSDYYLTPSITIGKLFPLVAGSSMSGEQSEVYFVASDSDEPVTSGQLSIPGNCYPLTPISGTELREENFKYSYTFRNSLANPLSIKSIYLCSSGSLLNNSSAYTIPLAGCVLDVPQTISPNETFSFKFNAQFTFTV